MATTYTVCEDQPRRDRYDVEVSGAFSDRTKAIRFMRKHYTAAERRGEDDVCIPFLRCDRTGDRFDNPQL